MARALVAALTSGGHRVELASTLRSFLPVPDASRQAAVEEAAAHAIQALAARWEGGARPDLWFTYHPFYKAPDLLGPRLACRFGLPYVTAEASHAAKRAVGPWASWHAVTETAIQAGTAHFYFTDRDRAGLARLVGPDRLRHLPPFIDAPPREARSHRGGAHPVELITVAMMRPGAKVSSYRVLAKALSMLPAALAWHLTVIGDGAARPEVEALFTDLPMDRIAWRGQISSDETTAALAEADLYVWPGIDEAYGVAYLEAGAAGLPSLAVRSGGVPSVVIDGETGLLVDDEDPADYAAALSRLMTDDGLRRRLGAAAHRFVREDRTIARAAAILSAGLAAASSAPARAIA